MKNNLKDMILNILIAIFCLTLIIVVATAVSETKNWFGDGYSGRRIEYILGDITRGDFSNVMNVCFTTAAKQKDNSEDFKEALATCRYYRDAFRMKAYEETGDDEKAAYWESKMLQAETQMGELSVMREEIHRQLSLD